MPMMIKIKLSNNTYMDGVDVMGLSHFSFLNHLEYN